MHQRRTFSALATGACLVASLALAPLVPPADAATTYTVTVGAKGTWTTPDDTPAASYIDKDGTYWFQQAHALYGATQGRSWNFFTGSTMDSATRSTTSDAVDPTNSQDKNNDTTWRCNNSPTGVEATNPPAGSSYSQRNFCDLAGVWVDPDTGNWYGLVHNEFTPQPFGDGIHFDAIDLAVSADQGRTWDITGHVITSPFSTKRGDTAAFPQQTYDYGDGDPRLFVDVASGYFYVFYGSRIVDKGGSWKAFHAHVARAPISSKMATGSWRKWYAGAWNEPGVGGRESNMVPVSTSATGYTDPAREYDPATAGSVATQVAAGTMPPTSPLFVMDVAWDAHLGLYIAEPQAVDQSGNAPQEYYATDNLASQKWFRLGDTGTYHNASWYRWFLDPASRTQSGIVGKSFRSYCSFGCSGGTSGEYVNVTIGASTPASPVASGASYRISSGAGRALAQVPGSTATTSLATGDSGVTAWTFTSTGDGAYTIAGPTGALLGVDATSNAGRAWGAKPVVTAQPAGGPSVGQQWWVVADSSAADGTATGSYSLVNRYSGLQLALAASATRAADTAPARTWTAPAGGVGDGRTAAEQTLTLTQVRAATSLNGTHTVVTGGKALDDPGHSKVAGTQLVSWALNGGLNQQWKFTAQPDGSYEVVNGESGLCIDVADNSLAAGGKVVQWTCNGGANQHWRAILQADGSYTLASVKSALLLTTASGSDGALVSQQPDSGSTLQRWAIG